MLRVKNEQRFIRSALYSLLPVCERIFVLDDHSTDLTPQICRQFPNVTLYESPFSDFDEARDKSWLLGKIAQAKPDWVLALDGDECLVHKHGGFNFAGVPAEFEAFGVQILYLWDREDQYRSDGMFREFFRPRIFRFDPQRTSFMTTRAAGNMHCSSIPDGYQKYILSDVKMLHFGYLNQLDRLKKYAFYSSTDPGNKKEGYYLHIIQGDPGGPKAEEHLEQDGFSYGPLEVTRFESL